MNTKVKIAPNLQEQCNLPPVLEVSGNTVGDCLNDMVRKYPDTRQWLFLSNGMLRVYVSINNDVTLTPRTGDMARILEDGDELHIFAIMAGG
jgi:molybdopterin converting factor small subunit